MNIVTHFSLPSHNQINMGNEIDLVNRMKQFDAYPKVLEDFRVKTYTGAMVTTISTIIMALLLVSELRHYMHTDVHPELLVDTARPEKLKINIDFFFPQLGCAYLSIDAMDISGDIQTDIEHGIFKKRYDKDGNPVDVDARREDLDDKTADKDNSTASKDCGSCYGAETEERPCCNTCEDVRKAYREYGWTLTDSDHVVQCKGEKWKEDLEEQAGEGCQIYGYLEVSKVAGRFLVATDKRFNQHPRMLFQFVAIGKDGRISMNFDDLFGRGTKKHNISHTIRSLGFGVPIPGVVNPLDGVEVIAEDKPHTYQYFIKIVPTIYKKLNGEVIKSSEYSVTKRKQEARGGPGETGPGVLVRYELSPLQIQYTERRRSFLRFMTGVCAIIGGVYTVAALIDSFIYRSGRMIKNKIQVGKAT